MAGDIIQSCGRLHPGRIGQRRYTAGSVNAFIQIEQLRASRGRFIREMDFTAHLRQRFIHLNLFHNLTAAGPAP